MRNNLREILGGEIRRTVSAARAQDNGDVIREEVCDWLQHIKHDAWFRSQMPLPFIAIARTLGIDYDEMNHFLIARNVIHRGKYHYKRYPMCDKIAALKRKIDNREIVFYPDTSRRYDIHRRPAFACFLVPIKPEPRLDPLISEAEWSLFARCKQCGKNQFMPIKMNGNDHAACYRCIPPSQYKAMGATLAGKILIMEALKAEGRI